MLCTAWTLWACCVWKPQRDSQCWKYCLLISSARSPWPAPFLSVASGYRYSSLALLLLNLLYITLLMWRNPGTAPEICYMGRGRHHVTVIWENAQKYSASLSCPERMWSLQLQCPWQEPMPRVCCLTHLCTNLCMKYKIWSTAKSKKKKKNNEFIPILTIIKKGISPRSSPMQCLWEIWRKKDPWKTCRITMFTKCSAGV